MGLPMAIMSRFSLVRLLVDVVAHSREVDKEEDETELAVERSLT